MVFETPHVNWASAQEKELSYWRNTEVPPTIPWMYYNRVFSPYIKGSYRHVIDVGSGPIPYFCQEMIDAQSYTAVDPLFVQYMTTKWMPGQWFKVKDIQHYDSTAQLPSAKYDAVFCFNMLDHVQKPDEMLDELLRLVARNGLLYLFVDVDKKPDQMHPWTIPYTWLTESLSSLTCLMLKKEKSWKFSNDVVYYVGKNL